LGLDELLPLLARSSCELLECERASVWIHNPYTHQLVTRVALKSEQIVVSDTSGVVGAAFTENTILNIPDPSHDPRFNREADRRNNFVTRSLLAAPMLDLAARPVGVIQAVNRAGGAFTTGDEALIRLLADQAAVAIQRSKLIEAASKAEALRREMDIARRVQRALIPTVAPEVDGLRAAGWTKPASMTGGDCYDLWPMNDGRLAVLVADATGHGIGPAMIVSQVRAMVRLLCQPIDGNPSNLPPTTILQHINCRLEKDLSPGQFVTAFLAFIGADGNVSWASAGHGPLWIKSRPDGPVECVMGGTGMPLGIMPDCFDSSLPLPHTLRLELGGTLLVMSDGIFEALDATGDQFGCARVAQVLDESFNTPDELLDALRRRVDAWNLRDDPLDDQTLVAVQRVGS
jgi:sigma-B regulation protein RsbU (phosphoserine phosphatase)